MVNLDGDAAHESGGGSAHLAGIFRIDLGMRALDDAQRAVANGDLSRLAVQFEKERPRAIWMRFADGKKLDDYRFAGFDFDSDLLARLQTVEESGGRQHTHVGVGLPELVELQENVGIKKVTEQRIGGHGTAELPLEFRLLCCEIRFRQAGAGAPPERCLATQNNALEFFRPAP